jgi:hypothetical protein
MCKRSKCDRWHLVRSGWVTLGLGVALLHGIGAAGWTGDRWKFQPHVLFRRTAEENVPVRHVGRPFRAVATARQGRPTGKVFPAARLTEKSGNWAQTGVADIDKDGRLDSIDIVSKCWGNPTTFVLLENVLDPKQRP